LRQYIAKQFKSDTMETTTKNIEYKMKFDVPDGYFDTLADNVMQRIEYEERKSKHKKNIVIKALLAVSSAAAVVGGIIFWPVSTESNYNQTASSDYDYQSYYMDISSNVHNDIAVLDYISQQEASSNSVSENYYDDIDILNEYPAPITFYYD
jgi:hypothetical protein